MTNGNMEAELGNEFANTNIGGEIFKNMDLGLLGCLPDETSLDAVRSIRGEPKRHKPKPQAHEARIRGPDVSRMCLDRYLAISGSFQSSGSPMRVKMVYQKQSNS